MWMFPLAIVCGNTFVLKPSERDPSCVLLIAQLLHDAGLPNGVMNVVNGDKEAVDTLLTDDRVQAVSFVGSTPVAEYIYTTATAHGKRCQALGGAKNHAIVMPDADMDNTVNQLLGAAFGSSGERCMALSVVVAVGNDTGDALVSKMQQAMTNLKVGAFNNPDNDFGPLITCQHKDKVVAHITSPQNSKVPTIVVDGRDRKRWKTGLTGFFVGATLIDERHDQHGQLPSGNFWACPASCSRADDERSDAIHRRPRIRKRNLYFHTRWRSGSLFFRPYQSGYGGDQCAASSSCGLSQFRWVEAIICSVICMLMAPMAFVSILAARRLPNDGLPVASEKVPASPSPADLLCAKEQCYQRIVFDRIYMMDRMLHCLSCKFVFILSKDTTC